ncbi:MAG: hypothetical protein FJ333_05410 [Sphingomonadales bacterium]|nr:hypothetical protein [Sphingomonadales bacterium]
MQIPQMKNTSKRRASQYMIFIVKLLLQAVVRFSAVTKLEMPSTQLSKVIVKPGLNEFSIKRHPWRIDRQICRRIEQQRTLAVLTKRQLAIAKFFCNFAVAVSRIYLIWLTAVAVLVIRFIDLN